MDPTANLKRQRELAACILDPKIHEDELDGVKEELAAARSYFERRGACVFCDILRQEETEGARIVSQNKTFFAFCPFASRSPFEVWILPRRHQADFGKLDPARHLDFAELQRLLRPRGAARPL